jgi:hypothetical protein
MRISRRKKYQVNPRPKGRRNGNEALRIKSFFLTFYSSEVRVFISHDRPGHQTAEKLPGIGRIVIIAFGS